MSCDDWHQHDLHDCLVSVPMMSFGWLFLTEWLSKITCWWWWGKLWTEVCRLRFSQLNNFFFFLHFLPFFCLPDCLLQLHCHFPRLVCYCLPAPVFACFVSIRLKFLPFSPFCCLFRSCIHTHQPSQYQQCLTGVSNMCEGQHTQALSDGAAKLHRRRRRWFFDDDNDDDVSVREWTELVVVVVVVQLWDWDWDWDGCN